MSVSCFSIIKYLQKKIQPEKVRRFFQIFDVRLRHASFRRVVHWIPKKKHPVWYPPIPMDRNRFFSTLPGLVNIQKAIENDHL
jgi:hypothetical protein